MQYIDLSIPINPQTLVYPGDPPVKVEPALQLAKDGCNDHVVTMGTHVGTHIDAPLHMLEGGKSLDQFGPDKFIGRGRLVKLRNQTYDLADFEQAGIEAGDIVLIYSGASDVYPDPSYMESYPAMPEDVARFLVEKRVKAVGVDMCSVDHDEFVSHRRLLKDEVLIIENVTNLKALEDKQFKVFALPIKLQIDGAPARVVAEVEE